MALNSENRSNMNKYTSLIPLLYPLNLEGNSWFATLYKNLLLSIFLENPGRSFNSDELINFLYKNYSLKVENVPEFAEILEILSKEDDTLIFQSDKYTMNPGKVAEVEDFYVKVLGIDDQEDGQIQSEYEDSLKAYATIDTEGLLWKSFYNDLFLPLVYHFYIRLTNPNYKTEKELLQSYKTFMGKFPQNKEEIHDVVTKFLLKNSSSFFKKHLIACIFFESVNGDIKEYDSILKLLEHPDNLDLFLERNMIYFMEIMLTMYSIEDRLKSSTASIASLLFEDSFSRNLHFTDIANKQNEFFKKNLREESSSILDSVKAENESLKAGFANLQTELSSMSGKVDTLKENFIKQSKSILKVQSSVEEKIKEHTENSINNLKNRNVEIINKITELSMIFVPVAIVLLSAVFYLIPEYILISAFGIGLLYLIRLSFYLFEIHLDRKLIQYFKNEVNKMEKNTTQEETASHVSVSPTSELQPIELAK